MISSNLSNVVESLSKFSCVALFNCGQIIFESMKRNNLFIFILSVFPLLGSAQSEEEFYLIAEKKGHFYGLKFAYRDSSSYKVTKRIFMLDIDSLPSANLSPPGRELFISVECSDNDFMYSEGIDLPINYKNRNQPFLPASTPFYFVQVLTNCIPAWIPTVWWPSYNIPSKDTIVLLSIPERLRHDQNISDAQLTKILDEIRSIENGYDGNDTMVSSRLESIVKALNDPHRNIDMPDSIYQKIEFQFKGLAKGDTIESSGKAAIVILTETSQQASCHYVFYCFLSIALLLVAIVYTFLRQRGNCCCCKPEKEETDYKWFDTIKSFIPENQTKVEVTHRYGDQDLRIVTGVITRTDRESFIALRVDEKLALIPVQLVVLIREVDPETAER